MCVRHPAFLIMIACLCASCGRKSHFPAQVTEDSVTSSAAGLPGKNYHIYDVTLRVKASGGGASPGAASDMFAGIVYLCGPAATKEVAGRILSSLSWAGLPSWGNSLSLKGKGDAPEVELLFQEDVINLADVKDLQVEGVADTFCMAVLTAPKDRAKPWDLSTTKKVRFLLKTFSIEGSGLVGGPNEQGIAAVCLCGFDKTNPSQPTLVRLSEPLFIVLRPSKQDGE